MAVDAVNDYDYLLLPSSVAAALSCLTAPVRSWFCQHFAEPTPAQRLAWPALIAGKTLLLCAPTGSGKTLGAFLPILSRLRDEPTSNGIRCLYVAPLKALISDTYKTLKQTARALSKGREGEAP